MNVLYSFCKTENFILSKEMCNLFFYIFTSPKVDSKQVAHFLDTKSEKFAEIVINNHHKYQSTRDNEEAKYKNNKMNIQSSTRRNCVFLDIENRNLAIKQILYTNKENFEIFFSKHTDLTEIEEKKNFILYELERLGNILNE